MKRWFRPIAYSSIALLVGLAVFGEGRSSDAGIVEALAPRRAAVAVADDGQSALQPVRERAGQSLPADLFGVEPPPPPPPAPVASAPQATPIPELKVLGWMQSDTGPDVFVEFNGESYTLKPTEAIGEAWRFDRIDAGSAEFTYLPTGESRRHPVSDPALLD